MEELAKKFMKTELKMKDINASLKALKEEKDATSELLMQCMVRDNIECINLDGHSIVLKNMKQYGALNKEYLENSLSQFCNSSVPQDAKLFAEKATEHLLSNRDVNEKQIIRLCKSKK